MQGLIGALQNSKGSLSEEQLSDAVFKALGFERLDETTLVEYLRKLKFWVRIDKKRKSLCATSSAIACYVIFDGVGAGNPNLRIN